MCVWERLRTSVRLSHLWRWNLREVRPIHQNPIRTCPKPNSLDAAPEAGARLSSCESLARVSLSRAGDGGERPSHGGGQGPTGVRDRSRRAPRNGPQTHETLPRVSGALCFLLVRRERERTRSATLVAPERESKRRVSFRFFARDARDESGADEVDVPFLIVLNANAAASVLSYIEIGKAFRGILREWVSIKKRRCTGYSDQRCGEWDFP